MQSEGLNPYKPPRAETQAFREPFADRLPRALLQGCLYAAIGAACGMVAMMIALRMADEGVEDVGLGIARQGIEFGFWIGFFWGGGMCVRRLLTSIPRPPNFSD